MFWKGGQINIVNYSYKKTLNDNLCNVRNVKMYQMYFLK